MLIIGGGGMTTKHSELPAREPTRLRRTEQYAREGLRPGARHYMRASCIALRARLPNPSKRAIPGTTHFDPASRFRGGNENTAEDATRFVGIAP